MRLKVPKLSYSAELFGNTPKNWYQVFSWIGRSAEIMGVYELAYAWMEKQVNGGENYRIIGPDEYDKREILEPITVKVFMEPRKEGTLPLEGGTFYLGDNAYPANENYQEHDVDEHLGCSCSAEGGVTLAYVAKKP
ncbi:hypothetical protein VE03_10217 [Pseudogymnoascus sp. 23342-1-I1]|nr:hypothetical protein VE03_10217 [Pseudogymnoascus sp. 23342-1-I1]